MPGFHWYDLIVLGGIALLIFGPKRLPEMGSAVGKTIREFQKSMREISEPTTPPARAIPPAEQPQQVAAPSPATSTPPTTAEATQE